MRLIDADALKDWECEKCEYEHKDGYWCRESCGVMQRIDESKTIYAVEVVLCKDCKWCFGDLDENYNAVFSCEQWNEQKTDPNGFCFAGVRREENEID